MKLPYNLLLRSKENAEETSPITQRVEIDALGGNNMQYDES